MRLILEGTRTAMTFINERNNNEPVEGTGVLRVLLFDPGEESPSIEGTTRPLYMPRLLSDLRAEAGEGKPLVAVPTGQFSKWLDPVVIPEELLRDVPADAKLSYRWRFEPAS